MTMRALNLYRYPSSSNLYKRAHIKGRTSASAFSGVTAVFAKLPFLHISLYSVLTAFQNSVSKRCPVILASVFGGSVVESGVFLPYSSVSVGVVPLQMRTDSRQLVDRVLLQMLPMMLESHFLHSVGACLQ